MHDLVQGVHNFNNVGRKQHLELFDNLKHGQKPEACFITCADSRILPNLITNSEPGQLFTIRNVGNLIPCYGTSNNGELALWSMPLWNSDSRCNHLRSHRLRGHEGPHDSSRPVAASACAIGCQLAEAR